MLEGLLGRDAMLDLDLNNKKGLDYNDEIRQEQLRELSYLNGSEDSSRGRGIRGRGIRVPPAAPSRFSGLHFTGYSGWYPSKKQQMRADYKANERIFLGKDIVMLAMYQYGVVGVRFLHPCLDEVPKHPEERQ
ncbi:hypothetical protein BTVI_58350 [Pitangus sulphuratus]|nr:hypothetical protein BTVI_58350 [Pitangus sulphuratus]